MPLTSFVNSVASKAQSALQQHIPQAAGGRPASPDAAAQPSANQSAGQGQRSHAFEHLQHQFRTFQQQYSSTNPTQKLITTGKGLAIDFDSASRDAKAQSKELYTWGQAEAEDLKDVTDRLAYLNFIHGSLASALAEKLDAARAPLKALRDAETAIAPRRNIRAGLKTQLARIEHEQSKGMEKKIAELQAQINKAEADDQAQEREIELLKRKGIRESEQIKWEAIREYGEKLALLSQAASHVVPQLPSVPPTAQQPYNGAQTTAAARAALQRSLDSYSTGHVTLNIPGAGADLSRHDTRSFGQSHASELSRIGTATGAAGTGLPLTPPNEQKSFETQHQNIPSTTSVYSTSSNAEPINPQALNQAPAPIPTNSNIQLKDAPTLQTPAHVSDTSLPVSDPSKPLASNTPTVAETGVPVSSGTGPGPSSGSLLDIKNERHETAEQEKKRLEREEVERARKEMEGQGSGNKKDDEDLPPYQEI